jgi:DNA-directed RNA polymerase specialized sigma subunit
MKTQFREDQIQFINQEIETLPEHEKNILKLRFWHCYTLDEIAFIHDIPITYIKHFYDEAIHRLRLNYLIEFSKPKDSEVACNQIAS